MGPAAVSCICAPGYTGDFCESQIASPGTYIYNWFNNKIYFRKLLALTNIGLLVDYKDINI